MDPTFFAQYQGFEFHCSPLRMPGGGFIPQLRVSADFGATRVELPVPAPPHGSLFVDAAAAAHRSFSQARRWVDSVAGDLGETTPALDHGAEPKRNDGPGFGPVGLPIHPIIR